jgi:uncharacterized protein (TIGR03089 family)
VPPTNPRRAAGLAHVLSALLSEPGHPRLTWYGPAGERIELSGAVLDNWVSKTTNLLVEELDAGPGTRVLLDLPPHWRTVVWALAAWRVGAAVVTTDGGVAGNGSALIDGRSALDGTVADDVDVVVSDRPGALALPRGVAVVAVALPALARRFDGDLPAGALDAAQSVMTYGDVVGWAPVAEPDHPALGDLPHAALLAAAADAAPVPDGSRTLLTVGDDRTTTAPTLLAVLGVLAEGGSVVLLRPEPGEDAARVERVVTTERVTARL